MPIDEVMGLMLGVPGAQGGAGGVSYLFRDTFTTPRAAGAVHDTPAEPGPGTRSVTIGANASITVENGAAVLKGNAAWSQCGLWETEKIDRLPGRVLQVDFSKGTSNNSMVGFLAGLTADFNSYNDLGFYFAGLDMKVRSATYTSPFLIRGPVAGALLTVLRAAGKYLFYDDGTDVRLLWWDEWSSAPTLYIGATSLSTSTLNIDEWRVPETFYAVHALASDSFEREDGTPGNTDGAGHMEANSGDGKAWADSVGTWAIVSDEAACSALADGVGMATLDAGTADVLLAAGVKRSGGVAGLVARYTDEDNCLIAYHDGANAKLDQVVGGDVTNLVSAAAAYAAGAGIRVTLDGQNALLYYNDRHIGRSDGGVDAGLTSTRHGLYTTDITNRFTDFVCFARYGYTDLRSDQ